MPGADMALTDKSTIALSVHDLRVVEGVPRFNDGRLATRLNIDRRSWRRRITQDEELAMENGLPSLCRSGTKSSGGRPYEDYLLTIAETIFYASRSEARNAPKLIAEVALVVEALRTGAPIPDTPWTDALFAPNVPTVERGDDNIVHVKHEEWEQPALFDDDEPRPGEIKPHPSQWSPSYDRWRERTIETTLPRPIGQRHLDCISQMGHTPQGYGDSTEDKPTLFMRDELPLGHSADSWRVWVSEQWFRLPLNLRQQWWRDTDYGNRAPSPEMIQAITFIALP